MASEAAKRAAEIFAAETLRDGSQLSEYAEEILPDIIDREFAGLVKIKAAAATYLADLARFGGASVTNLQDALAALGDDNEIEAAVQVASAYHAAAAAVPKQ